ncbi:MAG TPA: hypothetical protein VGB46_00370 [Flavisolibacter sp.]
MDTINPEQFRNLSLPADEPVTAHLETLISENETFLEEEAEATYIRLKGAEERIWVKTSDSVPALPEEDASFLAMAGANSSFCGTSDILPHFFLESISSSDKLRVKSKYYLGSTIVHVVFLSSPRVVWTAARKAAFLRDIMDEGHRILNRAARNDGQPFPKHNFVMTAEEFSMGTDPAVVPIITPVPGAPPKRSYDEIGINIKAYLKHKSVYHGNVNDYRGYASQPEVLQAFYEFVNLLRDNYNTEWGYLVFVVPDPGSNGRAHAAPLPGFMVMFERPKIYPWTAAHETLHMFGAADEYVDDDRNPDHVNGCRIRRAGLYDIVNSNCQTPDGNKCLMSKALNDTTAIWRERICTVTAQQLSLIPEPDGKYKPVNDFAVHTYEIRDNFFKFEGGVFLVSDVIRKNRHVWVHVEGKSKMNPAYFEHGPEGDLKTIVGQDHLLPGRPFSCVVGKWVSLDGTYHSPWFYVGKGDQWFQAPFPGYFVFNINDSKRNWGDNSGYMKVTLWSKLPDNCGPVFVPKNIWPAGAAALPAIESRFATFEEAGITGPDAASPEL